MRVLVPGSRPSVTAAPRMRRSHVGPPAGMIKKAAAITMNPANLLQ